MNEGSGHDESASRNESGSPARQPPPARRTHSITKRSRWPGWIWSVPIAALGIVAWLLVRAFTQPGIDVTVTFSDAGGMKARDTQVTYRGMEIGKVSSVALTTDRQRVVAHLDLDKAIKGDLTTGTRFYLEGAQLSFSDPASLKSIIAGPSILMIAGTGSPARVFAGTVGEPADSLAVSIPFSVEFSGAVGELKPGAAVILRGFTVGKVVGVNLVTDSQTGQITTAVLLDLDPTRFHIRNLPTHDVDWSATLRGTMSTLVRHGLRATLTQSPLLIGSEQVELVINPEAAPAELLTTGHYPEIPAAAGGLDELVAKLGRLPVSEIGDNLRTITDRIKKLATSPQLQDSIDHLDRSLSELDRTLHAAGPQVVPAIASVRETVDHLRHTADEFDGTAQAARKLLGSSAASPNGNLQQAVHELTGTARAIRTLANYLDQHPEALIRGRGEERYEENR